MSIRILEDAVVDQIAAGEVVERPASVLKELVENALDAGATRIDVSLRDGGSRLVAVADNGSGMVPDDAVLCLERHATSKIQRVDDLVGIRSLGFRGEALPSIASVSRFEIRTRPAEAEQGTGVRVVGGRLEHVGPVGCAPGTEISVRDLFHNVPARRKFLRTRQTELGHCLEGVHRQILMRPDVDVTVTHDGREVLRAPATEQLSRRVADLLGPDADALVPVHLERRGIVVQGLVGPVGVHRATAAGSVYTYVDGRFVRDPVVRRALTEAYRGLLPKGRHPLAVLSMTLPPGEVDVNVHPAKTEVRFARPREVMQVLTDAVREALEAPPIARPVRGVVPSGDDDQLDLLRPALHDPMPPEHLPPPAWMEAGPQPTTSADTAPVAAEPEVTAAPVAPTRPAPLASIPPTPQAAPRKPVAPPPAASRGTAGPVEVLARLGEVAVCRRHGDLLGVDLVAAAVAWATARLGQGRQQGGVPSQPLLVPARVTLPRRDTALIIERAEDLSALGVEVSAFGPSELAVMALPAEVVLGDPDALLQGCAEALVRDAGADLLGPVAGTAVVPPDADVPALLAGLGDLAGVSRSWSAASLAAWVRADG